MNSTTIRTSTEKVMEMAREMSSSHDGIGRMSTTRMHTTPSASATSPCLRASLKLPAIRLPALPPSKPPPPLPLDWLVSAIFAFPRYGN